MGWKKFVQWVFEMSEGTLEDARVVERREPRTRPKVGVLSQIQKIDSSRCVGYGAPASRRVLSRRGRAREQDVEARRRVGRRCTVVLRRRRGAPVTFCPGNGCWRWRCNARGIKTSSRDRGARRCWWSQVESESKVEYEEVEVKKQELLPFVDASASGWEGDGSERADGVNCLASHAAQRGAAPRFTWAFARKERAVAAWC